MKDILKKLFLLLGLKIKRTGKGLLGKIFPIQEYQLTQKGYPLKCHPTEEDKYKWLQNLGIKTIIDVGGYNGDFALEIHKILPNAKIYSFEPLQDTFNQLKAKLEKIPNSQAFNIALGDMKGKTTIYHNDFSPCSSILEVSDSMKEQAPFTQDASPETIEIDTLDDIAQDLELEQNILLKIDVQGFEDKVIKGGVNTISKVKLILTETSFQELYVGQALFSDIYKMLVDQLGFTYIGSNSQQKSPTDGYSFQEDSWFIRLKIQSR